MNGEPIFYVGGEWKPASQSTVHIFDSGLMYGDTITETLRTFRGSPYEVDKHLARLHQSLRLARIELPPDADMPGLIEEIVWRNRDVFPPDDELLIKVDVTRGVFGYYREPDVSYLDYNILLHVLRLPFWKFAAQYERGISVVYPVVRQMPPQTLDPRIKHRSRLYQALAEREAADIEPGAAALLLDIEGRVAEGTGWNVFVVKDGRLFTPSTESCLAGVSRAVVLELCEALGLNVSECSLWPYDLATADEAFATATSYCMLPITRVQCRAVGDGRRGPVTDRLLAAWGARAGTDVVGQARQRAVGLLM